MALQSRKLFFLLPKWAGNQQTNRSQCSRTRINRSRWAGGRWAAPVLVGTVSPALCDQSCTVLLALRQQLLLLCWQGPALASWPRPPWPQGTWLPALCLGKGGSSHAAEQWAEEGNVCLAFPGSYLGCVTVAKSVSLPCCLVRYGLSVICHVGLGAQAGRVVAVQPDGFIFFREIN